MIPFDQANTGRIADIAAVDLSTTVSPALTEMVRFLARVAARNDYDVLLRQQNSSHTFANESEIP